MKAIKLLLAFIALTLASLAHSRAQIWEQMEFHHSEAEEVGPYTPTMLGTLKIGALQSYSIAVFTVTADADRPLDQYDRVVVGGIIIDEADKILAKVDDQFDMATLPVKLSVEKGKPRALRFLVTVNHWREREGEVIPGKGDDEYVPPAFTLRLRTEGVVSPRNFYAQASFNLGEYEMSYASSGPNLWIGRSDAEIPESGVVGQSIFLGGATLEAWNLNKGNLPVKNLAVQVKFNQGRWNDIHRLVVVNQLGAVVARNPVIHNRGDRIVAIFSGFNVPEGSTAIFFRASFGNSFRGNASRKGGTATLVFDEIDQSLLMVNGEVLEMYLNPGYLNLGPTIQLR